MLVGRAGGVFWWVICGIWRIVRLRIGLRICEFLVAGFGGIGLDLDWGLGV